MEVINFVYGIKKGQRVKFYWDRKGVGYLAREDSLSKDLEE